MAGCPSCGAWFLWPPATADAMEQYYASHDRGMPRDLRTWREGTVQDGWYDVLARRMRLRAEKSNRVIASAVDVGAGGLELTRSMGKQFPDATLEAWDLFAEGRELPASPFPRTTLRRVDLNRPESWSTIEGRFDLVACVAVIEHVVDPLALLRLIRSITAPGGVAHVIGPDVGSVARRVMGRHWPYYCPDEHLTLPTFQSIERAVATLGGGRHELRRMNVHYSLQYIARFLRLPFALPRFADVLLPIPAGAFELVWERER